MLDQFCCEQRMNTVYDSLCKVADMQMRLQLLTGDVHKKASSSARRGSDLAHARVGETPRAEGPGSNASESCTASCRLRHGWYPTATRRIYCRREVNPAELIPKTERQCLFQAQVRQFALKWLSM